MNISSGQQHLQIIKLHW